ncbi:MAG: type II toxin-antitoxin system VapC family toxin [Acidobacteria bacterium]|nr:type II toxin-antitoxin system VapC family toxin [Acidobacteriota bacterium]
MIIADTDVLIDFLAGHEPSASAVGRELGRGNLRTTVISRFELLVGAHTARQKKVVRDLLGSVPALVVDAASSDKAASVRRDLERAGQSIGMADCLIAGVSLVAGAPLLTRNVGHFARVRELEVIEPT